MAPHGSYRIELFGPADLARIGWPSAAEDAEVDLFVFQTREFLEVWFKTMGAARGSEPLLLVVYDAAGEALLYLPLCLELRHGLKIVRFVDGGLGDYCAPALRKGHVFEPGAFERVWQKIVQALPAADLIQLRNMPDRILETPNPFLHLGVGRAVGQGSYLPLAGGWKNYQADPVRKNNLGPPKKKLRKLSRDHDVSFVRATAGAPLQADWVEAILKHKHDQYLRTTGQSPLAMPGYREFFRYMARPEQLASISTLDCLSVDGELAVGHLGYATAKRDYHILTSTNWERFGKNSVGTALLAHVLERGFNEGLEAFDFGIGSEPFKAIWATRRYDLFSYVKALTFKGRVAAAGLHFRPAQRSWRLPL